MRRLIPIVFLAACDTAAPGDARTFRDNFDSLASQWTITGDSLSVKVEDGRLRLTAALGPRPSVEYTLPTPFGPGWNLKFYAITTVGVPCTILEVSTGDSRRHAWVLELDASRNYWGLQVGDGEGWENVGSSFGGNDISAEGAFRLQVNGDDVGFWIDDTQVVDTVVRNAAPKASDISLGASRCNIRPGIVEFDWLEIEELGR